MRAHPVITRIQHPRLCPQPVWNLPVGDAQLWERVAAPAHDQLVASGWGAERIASRFADDLARGLRGLPGWAALGAVWLGGGLTAALPSLAAELRARLPVPVDADGAGAFVAESGGRALGGPDALVIDVGQTAIKAMRAGSRASVARDLRKLPLRFIGTPAAEPDMCAQIVDAVASLAADAAARVRHDGPVGTVVLALPCPVSDAGVPGACTYGFAGDETLVPRILDRLSGVALLAEDPRVLLLNDAELAALSALATSPLAPKDAVLCLTLGFGPGGCWLHPSRSSA